MNKAFLSLLIALCFNYMATSQVCTNLGQTPATAFPVCGTDVFVQTSVPACVNSIIPTNCPNDGNVYQDLNPYWYKFTCFESGSLGFLIEPNDADDDYDWQLFDVTGRNPADVYSDRNIIVSYNWSGEHGNTGASSSGTSAFVCGTIPNAPYRPLFSSMPQLIEGHQYLLLISHFLGDQQSGYKLSFGGGTASITDKVEPALVSATPNCDATQLRVKLNKKMKCLSLAGNGSDFNISHGSITVTGASSISCSGAFDMDSVVLTLSAPLPPGSYTVSAVNGIDGNTLKDNCDRTITVGDAVNFAILPLLPTPFDSLAPVKCAPSVLQLFFDKPIRCNSIAPNGSDFTVTGTQPVTVIGASGASCVDGVSSVINVQLSAPIYTQGNFQITLRPGIDGNTIIDECGQQSTTGQSLSFSVQDTVSAAFDYTIAMGCKRDTLYYSHNGNNGTNSWQWIFDNVPAGNMPDQSKIYPATGNFITSLVVTNGFCADTASANIILDNEVTADFEMQDILCPEDSALFINKSTGPIDSWTWVFGNTNTSDLETPRAQRYPLTGKETKYTVGLTVHSPIGCTETITKSIRVLSSCYIAVPSAFTPNNDGLNDYLYPLNALKADNLNFRVFNRWGQLVFSTNDWLKKWDGMIGGTQQAAGVYVWILQFTHHDTGKKVEMKGTTMLIR
jgi:gliding motility-associated-like protein